ncbi:MAG TPA: hypothetical protein VF172_01035 [Nitrososphaera sp.]
MMGKAVSVTTSAASGENTLLKWMLAKEKIAWRPAWQLRKARPPPVILFSISSSCLPAVSLFSPVASSVVVVVVVVVVLSPVTPVLLQVQVSSALLPPGLLPLLCFQKMVKTSLLVFTSCPKAAPVSKTRVKRIWIGLWMRKKYDNCSVPECARVCQPIKSNLCTE